MYINKNEGRGPPSKPSYGTPRLSRLGTFRELTRSGGARFSDQFVLNSTCLVTSSSSYSCSDIRV
jgi:hypothetical protein